MRRLISPSIKHFSSNASAASKRGVATMKRQNTADAMMQGKTSGWGRAIELPKIDSALLNSMIPVSAATMLKAKGHDQRMFRVQGSAPLRQTAEVMMRQGVGCVMLEDSDGKLTGMISERDVVKAMALSDGPGEMETKEFMTHIDAIYSVSPDSNMAECMDLMRVHQIRHVPVMCSQHGHGLEQATETAEASGTR